MKRIPALFLTVLMLAALLVGCGEKKPAEPAQPDNGQTETQESVDVNALYEKGMASFAANGKEAPPLMQENNMEFLNELFPGIADIEMTQSIFALSPVDNGPVEVDIVEVKNPEDVQKVIDIFQARVDSLSEDSTYPDNAEAWKNNSHVTSRGNLVILSVMTDWYGSVPADFILD